MQHTAHSAAERRTAIVASAAAVTMVVESAAGVWLGSMALLADGLHMASHTLAMAIAVFAYRYARQHAANPRFVFGTGKVNVLGGYTGAILLALSAAWMFWESLERTFSPSPIRYQEAAIVALVGLLVNAASAWLLRDRQDHGPHQGCTHADDHNLRAAYLHVLADATTSLLAILALLLAPRWNAPWLDPLVGVTGAMLVGWWSLGLLRASSGVLLDQRAPAEQHHRLQSAIESCGDRVAELRCWAVGENQYAAAIAVVTTSQRDAAVYRNALGTDHRVLWVTVEVRPTAPSSAAVSPSCRGEGATAGHDGYRAG